MHQTNQDPQNQNKEALLGLLKLLGLTVGLIALVWGFMRLMELLL
jgi:hypothetical protein